MGEYCFTLVKEFSLQGVLSSLLLPLDLPELEIIRLDRYVFANTYSISFASGSFHLLANQICLGFAPLVSIPMPLPAIGTILWRLSTESPSTLGSHSPWRVLHLSKWPTDLPSLKEFRGAYDNMEFVGRVILESERIDSIRYRCLFSHKRGNPFG